MGEFDGDSPHEFPYEFDGDSPYDFRLTIVLTARWAVAKASERL